MTHLMEEINVKENKLTGLKCITGPHHIYEGQQFHIIIAYLAIFM